MWSPHFSHKKSGLKLDFVIFQRIDLSDHLHQSGHSLLLTFIFGLHSVLFI